MTSNETNPARTNEASSLSHVEASFAKGSTMVDYETNPSFDPRLSTVIRVKRTPDIGKVQVASRTARGQRLAIVAQRNEKRLARMAEAEAIRTSLGEGEYKVDHEASVERRNEAVGAPKEGKEYADRLDAWQDEAERFPRTFRGQYNPAGEAVYNVPSEGETPGSNTPVGCLVQEARLATNREANRLEARWMRLYILASPILASWTCLSGGEGYRAREASASYARSIGFRASNSVEAYHFGQ